MTGCWGTHYKFIKQQIIYLMQCLCHVAALIMARRNCIVRSYIILMASEWWVVGEMFFVIIIILKLCHFCLQAPVNVKALEKQLQQKKDSEPIMAGILEEVRLYFQASLECSAAAHLIGKHVRQSENYRVSTVQENILCQQPCDSKKSVPAWI